jgi:hypothetical protein
MNKGLYYITNDVAVASRYCVKIDATVEDNNCYVAPQITDAGEPGAVYHIVFAETNADPVYVGTLDSDGDEEHRNEEDWATEYADEITDALTAAKETLQLDVSTMPIILTVYHR